MIVLGVVFVCWAVFSLIAMHFRLKFLDGEQRHLVLRVDEILRDLRAVQYSTSAVGIAQRKRWHEMKPAAVGKERASLWRYVDVYNWNIYVDELAVSQALPENVVPIKRN